MKRLLKGKKILVTREMSQAKPFSDLIELAGGIPIEVPLITIQCRNINIEMQCDQFNWIIFTSAHGVNCFFKSFNQNKALNYVQFATVGHKTDKALNKYGYESAFIPSTYNAEAMAEEFFEQFSVANNILLVQGNLSRKLLINELEKRNLSFDSIVVYDTKCNLEIKENVNHVLTTNKFDFITFTSPSTVRAFMEMLDNQSDFKKTLQVPAVCIGTTTEKTALQFNFTHTILPKMFTIESMVERMIEFNQM